MLICKNLCPGTYRVICIPMSISSSTFAGDYINTLKIVPVIDGVPRYTEEVQYLTEVFDDDLDRSSITTLPGIGNEHEVFHNKVQSYGIIDNASDGSGGYNRIYQSSFQDLLATKYKSISDYHPCDRTTSGNTRNHYTSRRTDSTLYWRDDWSNVWGNKGFYEAYNEITFGVDTFTVSGYYKDYMNGKKRTDREFTRTLTYKKYVGNGAYLDFTVPNKPSDFSIYVSRWKSMLDNLAKLAVKPPSADVFGASLDAAKDFNAYDVNLIEALAGFSGLDDLMPKGLSTELVDELHSFIDDPSLITALTKAVYLSASGYLYSKYVTANNIADFEQLTGLSGSKRFAAATDIASKVYASLTSKQAEEWNFRMAKMAQKIVYKYDYRQDSYGAKVARASNGFDHLTLTSRAHLQATPGPLRDMTAAGIICDDIGLSLRASRLAQTVKLEFVANWFLPIEDSLDRIEFNQYHLNQLYRVQKLTLSTKEVHEFVFSEVAALYGLTNVKSGSLSTSTYHRWPTSEFPPTTFQHPQSEALSLGRVLQGSALVITALGR